MSDEGLEAVQLLHKLWRGKIPTEEQARSYIRPDEDYHDYLLRRVYTVLRRKLYYATAYPLGGTTRKRIPADLWTVLEIHPPSGVAMGAGHEYYGLRFFEVQPAEPTTEEKPAGLGAHRPMVTEDVLRGWLVKQWETGRLDRDETEKAAKAHFSDKTVERRTFRKLLKETRPEGMGKIGRPPTK